MKTARSFKFDDETIAALKSLVGKRGRDMTDVLRGLVMEAVSPFQVGVRVRCHADCLTDPVVHRHFDGLLIKRTRQASEAGWWMMARADAHDGETLVHEQELEILRTKKGKR